MVVASISGLAAAVTAEECDISGGLATKSDIIEELSSGPEANVGRYSLVSRDSDITAYQAASAIAIRRWLADRRDL